MALKVAHQAVIFEGTVMHQRFAPQRNRFAYSTYCLGLPLHLLDQLAQSGELAVDRFGLTSFYRQDHGAGEPQGDLFTWASAQLVACGFDQEISGITLFCLPRIFGFVFNPVSFWLCFNRQGALSAVIYEVNNTYGESHSYVAMPGDGGPIGPDDWLETEKLFHVSPYLPLNGHYRFKINLTSGALRIWINYYNSDGKRTLATAMTGQITPYSRMSARSALLRFPLISFKTIGLIYWQALKLKLKGLRFLPLPKQNEMNVSRADRVNKL